MKRTGSLALVLVLSLFLGSCGGSTVASPGDSSDTTEVQLSGIAFEPKQVEIAAGDTVTWTNKDDLDLHTVTTGVPQKQGIPGVKEGKPSEPDGLIDHDFRDVGASFTFTFDEAGTYIYFCEVHAGMTGEVVVTG